MPYQNISPTEVNGVYLIQPKVFGDERGWYCPELEVAELESAIGLKLSFTQIASSYNEKAGILRGLHFQKPNPQGKIAQVSFGSVLDVALDVRRNSPTFGRHVEAVLTAKDHNQLFIPAGCAHGFIALEPGTRFNYFVTDGIYDTSAEKGVKPFDPELNINWRFPREQMNFKDRDLHWPNLKDIPTENLL